MTILVAMHRSKTSHFRMELEVRFELTWTLGLSLTRRVQSTNYATPANIKSYDNHIRKYTNPLTDLHHTPSFKYIINIHSREAEQ